MYMYIMKIFEKLKCFNYIKNMDVITFDLHDGKIQTCGAIVMTKLKESKFFSSLMNCCSNSCETIHIPFPIKFIPVFDIYYCYINSNKLIITDVKKLKLCFSLADFVEHEQFFNCCIQQLLSQIPEYDIPGFIDSFCYDTNLQSDICLQCPLFLLPETYLNPKKPFLNRWIKLNNNKSITCGVYSYKHVVEYDEHYTYCALVPYRSHIHNHIINSSQQLTNQVNQETKFELHGLYIQWYCHTKNLRKTGLYHNGKQHKYWKAYYSGGDLAGIGYYKNGNMAGDWKSWLPVGMSYTQPILNNLDETADLNMLNNTGDKINDIKQNELNKPSFNCVIIDQTTMDGHIMKTHDPNIGDKHGIHFHHEKDESTFYYLSYEDGTEQERTPGSSALAPTRYTYGGLINIISNLLYEVLEPQY